MFRLATAAERSRSAAWLACVGLVAVSCSSGPSRAEVVGGVTESVVPELFDQLVVVASTVVDGVQVWCDGNGDEAAVAAIGNARVAWVELDPFTFGPVNERRSMFIIDPRVRVEDVDALGVEGLDVDATSLRELAGADQRGWGAVEHLVAGEATERRCDYATGAATLVVDELTAVAEEWDSYGASTAADDESANIALRNIVSESLFAARMAIDEPDPLLDNARIQGLRLAMVGDDDASGISPLLSDDLVARLIDELDAGDVAAIELTISTEVVGELGTTVNFSDADGDG